MFINTCIAKLIDFVAFSSWKIVDIYSRPLKGTSGTKVLNCAI